MVLTSHMGVAYASGLSKNGTWSDSDAVVPVMKVCCLICHWPIIVLTLYSILPLMDLLRPVIMQRPLWDMVSDKSYRKCWFHLKQPLTLAV